MATCFSDIFTARQLVTLASIVQVGDAAYRDLMETQRPMFAHPYFADTRGRIRTKFVQMQCEIESHEPNFPFEFSQRYFEYNQCIPELRTKNVILHIARSTAPDCLPYESKYKLRLSNNNFGMQRQMVIDTDFQPPYSEEPFYGCWYLVVVRALLPLSSFQNLAMRISQRLSQFLRCHLPVSPRKLWCLRERRLPSNRSSLPVDLRRQSKHGKGYCV